MKPYKTILFLGDGMADEPIAELNNRTPLQAANTPNMDKIAAKGRSGTFLSLPDGFPTSSDVANMSVLGGDLATELCGRGPLEAASQGIVLEPNQIAFRMNITSVDDQGILRDFSGGHISQEDAEETIALLNRELGSEKVRFAPGVSYRNLLILTGDEFSADISYHKPDDNHGVLVAERLPQAKGDGSEVTAALLCDLISKAAEVLRGRQANGIWPWSGGRTGNLHSVSERYGLKAAVISAVDVIKGLGCCMGLDVINVPGATGYIDTNYEGKADAAVKALENYDFIYVHVEAMDEVSHAQDLKLKLQALEDFDSRIVGRVMQSAGENVAFCVLPDHPVPLATGKHTRTPVPVAVWQPGVEPDSIQSYDELSAQTGALGYLKGSDLMDLLLR
ncbi:MAG: cofactor-independent phosphoglycerate mutase [Kiritimatiellae bacterium]|jgi:2,3-bisphosphoglycerate-independent phosphoglycerate mutase|nr:cofactor-independent phosphoglycerate mutase [Kiritimatiellia bacterium]